MAIEEARVRIWPDHGCGSRTALASALSDCFALRLSGVMTSAECRVAAQAVEAARADWVPAFEGEQYSLGRAWYTHYEEDQSREYFASAAESDALVERYLPGIQRRMHELVAALTGGHVGSRHGWCGPGVHVFPAGECVSERGGVIHFDTEGLPTRHIRTGKAALTLLVMIQEPEAGGGIRLWDSRYSGSDVASDEELARASQVVEYQTGEAVIFDSYRLHQIQPFRGSRDRYTLTAHAAEVDRDRWEIWF